MKKLILASWFILLSLQGLSQSFSRIEYYWDTDPGFGNGTALSGVQSGTVVDFPDNINTGNLAPGLHYLYVRGRTGNGPPNSLQNRWTPVLSKPVFIYPYTAPASSTPGLVKAEYFWDVDPGLGNAVEQSLPGGNEIFTTIITPVGSLTAGLHFLGSRVQSNTGQWSATRITPLLITPTTLATSIIRVEYFIDTDPGLGLAQSLAFTPNPGADVSVNTNVNIGPLSTGSHLFFARTRDNNNTWSAPVASLFSVLGSCTSLQTGLWSSISTWSCGRVPNAFDIVQISPSHTVTIGNEQFDIWKLKYAGVNTGGKVFINNGGRLNIKGIGL